MRDDMTARDGVREVRQDKARALLLRRPACKTMCWYGIERESCEHCRERFSAVVEALDKAELAIAGALTTLEAAKRGLEGTKEGRDARQGD